jgi:3-methylcrotonyl-CoA carboxylase alpha subunit
MKVIAWNEDRDSAIQCLREALGSLQIAGLKSNRDYLCEILFNDDFEKGTLHTLFLDQHHELLARDISQQESLQIMTTAAQILLAEIQPPADLGRYDSLGKDSPWHTNFCWRLNESANTNLYLRTQDELLQLRLSISNQGKHLVAYDTSDGQSIQALIEDVALPANSSWLTAEQITIFHPRVTVSMQRPHPGMEGQSEEEGRILAPMSGRVIAVHVAVGDQVEQGDVLVVLEAMKMEHTLIAPGSGKVINIAHTAGDLVDEGVELVELAAEDNQGQAQI